MEHEELNINWKTGHMMIVMDRFFPCSVKDLNFLLNKCICLDWEHEGDIIKQIEDHCIRVIAETEEYKKSVQAHKRNTEAKVRDYARKYEESDRLIEKYKKNLEILKQRK